MPLVHDLLEFHTLVHTLLVITIHFFNFSLKYGRSPLLAAIERGHTDTAQLLIDKEANVNKCDKVCTCTNSSCSLLPSGSIAPPP